MIFFLKKKVDGKCTSIIILKSCQKETMGGKGGGSIKNWLRNEI
jgi:hypothetical protein